MGGRCGIRDTGYGMRDAGVVAACIAFILMKIYQVLQGLKDILIHGSPSNKRFFS